MNHAENGLKAANLRIRITDANRAQMPAAFFTRRVLQRNTKGVAMLTNVAETSLDAKHELNRTPKELGRQCAEVVDLLRRHRRGLVAREIAALLGWEHSTVAARVNELLTAGRVKRTGEKRKPHFWIVKSRACRAGFVLVAKEHFTGNQTDSSAIA